MVWERLAGVRPAFAILASVLMLGSTSVAAAQSDASAQAEAKSKSEIVVTGKLSDTFGDYVRKLTNNARHGQLARWNYPICVTVAGLNQQYAAFIRGAILDVAHKIGVRSSQSTRCSPNIVVVFTPDSDRLAAEIVDKFPRLFSRMDGPSPAETSPEEFKRTRSARWLAVDQTGRVDDAPPQASIYFPSRIRSSVKQNVVFTYEIVDSGRLRGVTWGQIADYLAMVAFAHPSITPQPINDSILALDLGNGSPAPPGLTDHDLRLLNGWYNTDPSLTASQQRGAIVRNRPR